ncbi:MAG: DUF1801 domain-containing protein [Pyrinomonadaceae bacterium]
MEKVKTSPDEFIASLPDETRPAVEKLDKQIAKIMKGEERVLWTGIFWGGSEQNIIGYGDLSYERKGKTVKWFKIGLASQKNYISIYVNAVDGNKYLTQKYGDALGKVKVGASSISFKKTDDLNLDKFTEMLKMASELLKDQPLQSHARQ